MPTVNEISLLIASALVGYAYAKRIRHYGGFRKTVALFLITREGGEVILLTLLVIPALMQVVYYGGRVLPLDSVTDEWLRVNVAQPSILTSDLILIIVGLNGWLTKTVRKIIEYWIQRWNNYLRSYRT